MEEESVSIVIQEEVYTSSQLYNIMIRALTSGFFQNQISGSCSYKIIFVKNERRPKYS